MIAKSNLPDDDQLVTTPSETVAGLPLPEGARRFLTKAGLPKSCAPFVTFDELANGLRRIWEVFAPGQWKPEEKNGLEPYLLIGSDGAGNPFCLDERDGRVVLVDHEVLFDPRYRGRMVTFVNSSIEQLAESLLLINSLPSSALFAALKQVDEPAVSKGAFWFHETMSLSNDVEVDEDAPAKPWWKFW